MRTPLILTFLALVPWLIVKINWISANWDIKTPIRSLKFNLHTHIFLLLNLFYILLNLILANIALKLMLPCDIFISIIPWAHPKRLSSRKGGNRDVTSVKYNKEKKFSHISLLFTCFPRLNKKCKNKKREHKVALLYRKINTLFQIITIINYFVGHKN